MMSTLDLKLQVEENVESSLALKSALTVHEELKNFYVSIDGVRQPFHWTDNIDFALPLTLTKGVHRLSIDFNGKLPSALLTIPKETVAILDALPQLVDPSTLEPDPEGTPWNSENPPEKLETIPLTFFIHNHQLRKLSGFFRGLKKLKTVPEALFYPLIHVTDFSGLFKDSALSAIPPRLFGAAEEAENFAEAFMNCPNLTEIPETLFEQCKKANNFSSLFENTPIKTIPEKLFRNTAQAALYKRTFAHTDVKIVPKTLLKDKIPQTIDGMFEPKLHIAHDPILIKSGPKFDDEFFVDTVYADGIATFTEV